MSIDMLLEDVSRKQIFFDQFCAAWRSEYQRGGGKLFCGKGCSGCCSLVVNCTFMEALAIARTLSARQVERLHDRIPVIRSCAEQADSLKDWLTRYRQQARGCPFLEEEGSCGIYQVRPLSCRSLYSTREPEWCCADFATLTSDEKQQFMADLDRSAVAFPTHYAATPQEVGQELELAALKMMEDAYGCSLLGNLPWLVWMALEYRLAGVLPSGADSVRQKLLSERLANPYLVILNQ